MLLARLGSDKELEALCDAVMAGGPLRAAIAAGGDPLGDAFARLRSPAERRPLGATYTPIAIVDAMVDWARRHVAPVRVVDPGCGSGRFLLAAARAFPGAELIGVEIDPLAARVARTNLAARAVAARIEVGDYRDLALEAAPGPTLFLGNPPYVRHHAIAPAWKAWLSRRARARGLTASQLAGLHVHFLLATADLCRAGDAGVFITASEWLDVNYGRLARQLLAGPLGLVRLDLLEPSVQAFPDAMVTAVIAAFEVGAEGPVSVRRAASLGQLAGGRTVARDRLRAASRWSELAGVSRRPRAGMVELGELCRVHRGQVTGNNRVWIAGPDTPPLPPRLLVAAVTRARELFEAGPELAGAAGLRRVIALPAGLDDLDDDEHGQVERFLRWARERGADRAYVARHRAPWWSVRLAEPAPILATYMARRPPAFVRNRCAARHINIAHGIYPREPLSRAALDRLADCLRAGAAGATGRTYAGGLMKFEPREMERILIPRPA